MSKKVNRIQFDVSDQELIEINNLIRDLNFVSRATLFRKALRLLAYYAKETKAGNEMQVSGPSGVKQIFIL